MHRVKSYLALLMCRTFLFRKLNHGPTYSCVDQQKVLQSTVAFAVVVIIYKYCASMGTLVKHALENNL